MSLKVQSARESVADRTILALDGGNSKTDVVLLRGDGAVLQRARSGPFLPHLIGAPAAVDSLESSIDTVLAAAGLDTVDHVAAYLANADLPVEEDRIKDAIVLKRWGHSVTVENDTLAMLRAGTRTGHGVAVVCGAGINCIGVSPTGDRVRYSALGRITGDWGGGLGLAEEVLWASSRAEDGRGELTALSEAVARHFQMATAVDVAQAMHLEVLDAERMHELVPLLLSIAEAGDEVARRIVAQQAQEIVLLASVTLSKLDLMGTPTDIVLGGGILGSARPILLDPVLAGLREAAPLGRVLVLESVPVVGSALLGLEHLWAGSNDPASAAALARVRIELGGSADDD